MPIAVRIGNMAAVVSEDSPSVTTSIHRNQTRYMLAREGYAVAMLPADTVKNASRTQVNGQLPKVA